MLDARAVRTDEGVCSRQSCDKLAAVGVEKSSEVADKQGLRCC